MVQDPGKKTCTDTIVHISTGSPAVKKHKANQDNSEELHFGLLLPFKNQKEGLKAFSYAVTNYTSEPFFPRTLQKC